MTPSRLLIWQVRQWSGCHEVARIDDPVVHLDAVEGDKTATRTENPAITEQAYEQPVPIADRLSGWVSSLIAPP